MPVLGRERVNRTALILLSALLPTLFALLSPGGVAPPSPLPLLALICTCAMLQRLGGANLLTGRVILKTRSSALGDSSWGDVVYNLLKNSATTAVYPG